METVLRNPYQIELDTIIATQNPDGANVLVRLADTILPDYHALKLFPEMVYCNDVLLPTEAVRDGKTLLLADAPEQKVLRLRISYAMRKHLLQQVTTRLILTVLCQNYFACTPIFFAHPTSDRIVRLTLPAMIDDEATVKRFYKENGHFRLQPENDAFKPIIVDEVIILGKVVGLMRYYD